MAVLDIRHVLALDW